MSKKAAGWLEERLAVFDPLAPGEDAQRYARDWSGDLDGQARMIVRPCTAAEVAKIVALAAEAGARVVPQGGHTGLVGGATPTSAGDEVVVSLERLNRVREIDALGFTLVAEAGCVLETVHQAAAEQDCIFPLYLGAQGSCQIGGNIATNAGGLNVLRYGMMRNLVLGLEVVLPDGQIWNGLRKLYKNNTGYDLKQLFIGSEGTLGIVTAASLKLFPRPEQVETAFLAVESPAAAVALLGQARRDLADLLSAFEILERPGLDLAFAEVPGLRDPLATPGPCHVLLEASASGLVDLKALVETFLERAIEKERILDGVLASNLAQAKDFWRLREALIEVQVRRGRHLRTDVSVPVSRIAAFLDEAKAELSRREPQAQPLVYGHLGDGNIHFNVLPPRGLAEAETKACLYRCQDIIFAAVDSQGGSISAEHGVGLVKRDAFHQRLAPLDETLMRGIKTLIDPAGLMSPGRVLAPEPKQAS